MSKIYLHSFDKNTFKSPYKNSILLRNTQGCFEVNTSSIFLNVFENIGLNDIPLRERTAVLC